MFIDSRDMLLTSTHTHRLEQTHFYCTFDCGWYGIWAAVTKFVYIFFFVPDRHFPALGWWITNIFCWGNETLYKTKTKHNKTGTVGHTGGPNVAVFLSLWLPPWCSWCACCRRWVLPEWAGNLLPVGRSLVCSWWCFSHTGGGEIAGPPRCRASRLRCAQFPGQMQQHNKAILQLFLNFYNLAKSS